MIMEMRDANNIDLDKARARVKDLIDNKPIK